jgi:hypothetical protein
MFEKTVHFLFGWLPDDILLNISATMFMVAVMCFVLVLIDIFLKNKKGNGKGRI